MSPTSRAYLKRSSIKLTGQYAPIEDSLGTRVEDAVFYRFHILRVDYQTRTIQFKPNMLTSVYVKNGFITFQFNRQTTVTLLVSMIEEIDLDIAD